jgi:hypothetical protein
MTVGTQRVHSEFAAIDYGENTPFRPRRHFAYGLGDGVQNICEGVSAAGLPESRPRRDALSGGPEKKTHPSRGAGNGPPIKSLF